MNIFHRKKNGQILVNSIYLFYNTEQRKLFGSNDPTFGSLPFVCTPKKTSISEQNAFLMYPSHNLYYIISNGGIELNREQAQAIMNIRHKVVGFSETSRIENEKTATLSRKEIQNLIDELGKYVTEQQIKLIAKGQEINSNL